MEAKPRPTIVPRPREVTGSTRIRESTPRGHRPDWARQRATRRWAILASAVICLTAQIVFAAVSPDLVADAQRELTRKQFYFGPITGQIDETTVAAIRRFQIRHALKVTGTLDDATLAVLATEAPNAPGNSTGPDIADDTPERERAQAMVRDDEDVLRDLERDGALPPSSSTGEPAPQRAVSIPEFQGGPPTEVPSNAAGASRRPETRPPTSRAEKPEPDRPNGSKAPAEPVGKDDVLRTVDRFIASWNNPKPDQELAFYADRVDYYGQGKVSHANIVRDQKKYYSRWPNREFMLLTEPQIVRAADDEATVRYRYRYSLANGNKTARGAAEHFLKLRRSSDGFKVVSVRERKISE